MGTPVPGLPPGLVGGGPGLAEPVTLSALEFDVLREHLGLEQMPLVLKVPSPGRTDVERRALVDSAWESLGARGLGRPVELHPGLESALRLLSRPDRELDGRLWVGAPLRVLAAAVGDEAVLATLSGDELTLRGAEATGLPRHVLSVLPAAPAGPGQSLTLRTADFEAAATATEPAAFGAALRDRGVRSSDATQLAEMITDVTGQGQFGSARRDRWGKRVRAGRVISYFDTAEGRYLQVRRQEPAGEAWTTISPADRRRMLQHLTDLHTDP